MQSKWDLQFLNSTTPKAAVEVLQLFYENQHNLLKQKQHNYFWNIMRNTKSGPKRIKGKLPEGTTLTHKTGR